MTPKADHIEAQEIKISFIALWLRKLTHWPVFFVCLPSCQKKKHSFLKMFFINLNSFGLGFGLGLGNS